ncbi:MAG TPA: hypothetical protein VHW44_23245 [Pseudonocardiaceae bacterium]|jgi:UDP:flavonoid glycosyltransferase YjiC (YdhE family)|nr:hypothetical protein [Pseudonocardiaceae bacterium]
MKVLLCPLSAPGYRYPAIAVGLELRSRHDEVYLLGPAGALPGAAAAGLQTLPVEAFGGAARDLWVSRWFRAGVEQYQLIRRAARSVDADVLVTSMLCPGALAAAASLGLPVLVLGFATHVWSYAPGPDPNGGRAWRLALLRQRFGELAERVGLPASRIAPDERALIGNGLLLRGSPALEHPDAVLPQDVRHVGPCWWEPPVDPAEIEEVHRTLDQVGKPVVYVHLGRTFGGTGLWPRLTAAFTGGRFQAVVELGRSGPAEPCLGADLLPVRLPWLTPLLARAELVLTSATSAPVLGALLAGRPLLVAPTGSEQPVLAEACLRTGVASLLPTEPADCAAALNRAWDDTALRQRARRLGGQLPGAAGAAEVVHAAVTSRASV